MAAPMRTLKIGGRTMCLQIAAQTDPQAQITGYHTAVPTPSEHTSVLSFVFTSCLGQKYKLKIRCMGTGKVGQRGNKLAYPL